MAGGVRGNLSGPERTLISAVGWMRRHGEPVDEQMWASIYEIAQTAKRASVRLAAYREFIARFDPVPKVAEPDDGHRPIAIQINIGPARDADLGLDQAGSIQIRLGGDQPDHGGGMGGVRDAG